MRESDRAGIGGRSGATRREFLRTGGAGSLGMALGHTLFAAEGARPPRERSVILLTLVGGPSQLETWDPKPGAPSEYRGPFDSIATSVPGVRINEFLPRLARRMDQFALIRSVHHDAAPIHETGLQLIQTGRVGRLGNEQPHVGSLAARCFGNDGAVPPFVLLPQPIGNTGVGISHGQDAGNLGASYDPVRLRLGGETQTGLSTDTRNALDLSREPARVVDSYGHDEFGRSCLSARRLVEAGSRVVTVNMHGTVFNRVSWDCHGSAPFSTLEDYRVELLPTLDRVLSALLDDLDRLGLLESTLVVATGEFGRTPKLNAAGGRDHWPGVWSALLAGGGVRGGQVIGASDSTASEPVDRPVPASSLFATMRHTLGLSDAAGAAPLQGIVATNAEPSPVFELFA